MILLSGQNKPMESLPITLLNAHTEMVHPAKFKLGTTVVLLRSTEKPFDC
ncbi:Uncharacterised protein [Klebsiella pneumoniae]|jgi:hypothetical protein|nr:Uncharacterised protein [Enterobacter hormaechei]STH53171.1 Uncharacterised protein [Escherichia coli]SWB06002.1 Uncharacterised protein [Klebsiella pneumoniae]